MKRLIIIVRDNASQPRSFLQVWELAPNLTFLPAKEPLRVRPSM